MDAETLTDSQRGALSQLRDLTAGADDEVSIGVLESVEWDVQAAAELIFGGGGLPPPPAPPKGRIEQFEIDDTEQTAPLMNRRQRHQPTPAAHPPTPSTLAVAGSTLFAAVTLPLHVLASVLRFVFNILHIPFPRGLPPFFVPRFPLFRAPLSWNFTWSNIFTGRSGGDAAGAIERWVRELEEETGSVCIGRRHITEAGAGSSSSSSNTAGFSSSTITSRAGTASSSTTDLDFVGGKFLPDFFTGTYEEMLRVCDREARIGCVVLVSAEHDDVGAFKRHTLTDPTLVKLLYENDVLVWGGDVRDREAWSASEKLQATTYPFVAFLALQPRRNPSSSAATSSTSPSTSRPTLTILSRHQGPSTNAGPTSSESLSTHLTSQLLPRVLPFILRVRTEREHALLHPPMRRTVARQQANAQERASLDQDRSIRAAQDAAFAESARRDRERLQENARRAREAKAREEEARAAAQAAVDERERLEMERLKKIEERVSWRVWLSRTVVADEHEGSGGRRIAIRLPNGERKIRSFSGTTSLTQLYAFVDSCLLTSSASSSSDFTPPSSSKTPQESLESEILSSGYTPPGAWWGFKLVLAYPRKEIPWEVSATVESVGGLEGGGQVVVEMIENSLLSQGGAEEDDEYASESDSD